MGQMADDPGLSNTGRVKKQLQTVLYFNHDCYGKEKVRLEVETGIKAVCIIELLL